MPCSRATPTASTGSASNWLATDGTADAQLRALPATIAKGCRSSLAGRSDGVARAGTADCRGSARALGSGCATDALHQSDPVRRLFGSRPDPGRQRLCDGRLELPFLAGDPGAEVAGSRPLDDRRPCPAEAPVRAAI